MQMLVDEEQVIHGQTSSSCKNEIIVGGYIPNLDNNGQKFWSKNSSFGNEIQFQKRKDKLLSTSFQLNTKAITFS